ncbi:hypothetical protein M0R45_001138 [Rubus argutus]|uniref:Uncharacterized protein n=1 Tax=Rubus argutus TaxID=59490 RepID=A0AAW1VN01_RUBAR
MGNCTSFEVLSLQGNRLTRKIPEVIGLIQALAVLAERGSEQRRQSEDDRRLGFGGAACCGLREERQCKLLSDGAAGKFLRPEALGHGAVIAVEQRTLSCKELRNLMVMVVVSCDREDGIAVIGKWTRENRGVVKSCGLGDYGAGTATGASRRGWWCLETGTPWIEVMGGDDEAMWLAMVYWDCRNRFGVVLGKAVDAVVMVIVK